MVTITTDGTTTTLEAPYHPSLPARAKAIGGKFRPQGKIWVFDARDEQRVRDLARDIYGTDGTDADQPAATVRVPLHNGRPGWGTYGSNAMYLAGHEIASRSSRDSAVRLGRGVVIIAGQFERTGGSVKNPDLGDCRGITVEIRDLSASTADRIVAEFEGAELVGPETERIAALKAERTNLLARLAEIDATLAVLDQG